MQALRKVAILACLCGLAACSPEHFLTRRLAAALITRAETFKAPQQFWLHTGVISNKEYLSPEYLVLQHRGWVTSASALCPPAISPPPCWDVGLTPLGVEAFHELISSRSANSQYVGVPIASRQLTGVTGISKASNYADVEFRWKWIPLNEVGIAFHGESVEYQSAVTFKYYDDGWRLLEGAALKSSQTLEGALKNTDPPQ